MEQEGEQSDDGQERGLEETSGDETRGDEVRGDETREAADDEACAMDGSGEDSDNWRAER